MDGSNWRWGPGEAPDGEPRGPLPPAEGDDGPSGIVILLVAALLVGGGYVLAHKLSYWVQIQNCVLQGRAGSGQCAI